MDKLNDDVKLLKECDSGVKMGIDGISHVIEDAKGENFQKLLEDYENRHKKIETTIKKKLLDEGENGKDYNPMLGASSWMSTKMKMMMDNSNEKIADLMIDGCNMGIKGVSKYMNQYSGATQDSMNIADSIVKMEQDFANDLRQYL